MYCITYRYYYLSISLLLQLLISTIFDLSCIIMNSLNDNAFNAQQRHPTPSVEFSRVTTYLS